jgi:hypothetical protein
VSPLAAAAAAVRVREPSEQGGALLAMLFPHLAGLRVHRVEDTGDAAVIWASSRAEPACCPGCGRESCRVHGGSWRVVAGGAVGGRPVRVVLAVRRFRCGGAACPRATFAGQAGGLTGRYRRRGVPLPEMLARSGLELAGRAGARLAGAVGITVHPSAVLRLVTALPDPQAAIAPQIPGIGDFAQRQGAGVRDRGGGRAGRRHSRSAPGPGILRGQPAGRCRASGPRRLGDSSSAT